MLLKFIRPVTPNTNFGPGVKLNEVDTLNPSLLVIFSTSFYKVGELLKLPPP